MAHLGLHGDSSGSRAPPSVANVARLEAAFRTADESLQQAKVHLAASPPDCPSAKASLEAGGKTLWSFVSEILQFPRETRDLYVSKSSEVTEALKQLEAMRQKSSDSTAASLRSDKIQSKAAIKAAFQSADTDNSGTISMDELRRLLLILDPSLAGDCLPSLFKHLDKNGDGVLSYDEFVDFLFGAAPELAAPKLALKRLSNKRGIKIDTHFSNRLRTMLDPSLSGITVERMLKKFDRDGDGALSKREIKRLLRVQLKISEQDFSDAQIGDLVFALDDDGSQTVSINELVDFLHKGSDTFFAVPNMSEEEITEQRVREKVRGLKSRMSDVGAFGLAKAMGITEEAQAAARVAVDEANRMNIVLEAFVGADTDGDGVISMSELREVLQFLEWTETRFLTHFTQADKDQDRVLSESEFVDMAMKLPSGEYSARSFWKDRQVSIRRKRESVWKETMELRAVFVEAAAQLNSPFDDVTPKSFVELKRIVVSVAGGLDENINMCKEVILQICVATMYLLAGFIDDVCLVNGSIQDPSWNGARKMLRDIDGFRECVLQHGAVLQEDKVPVPNLEGARRVRTEVGPTLWRSDSVETLSVAAARLCDWVDNVLYCHGLLTTLCPKSRQLNVLSASEGLARVALELSRP